MTSLSELLAGHGDLPDQTPPDYILTAPNEVRHRVKGLKGLQLETIQVHTQFYERIHALEVEFRSKLNTINAKRAEIVKGEREPTALEVNAEPIFNYMDAPQQKKFEEAAPVNGGTPITGIPGFWLHVLQNSPHAQDLITPEDEQVLEYLQDITVQNIATPPGFKLEFHFADNPFFTNQVLTKEYNLSLGPNGFEPTVLYDGPSVISTSVCKIDWNEGKNITKKVVKKKQKKGGNAGRYVVKTVEQPSFFQYFTPSETEIKTDLSEDVADLLNADFELGQILRETVIDNAVLYYTGEVADDESFAYGEDFEDGEDEDEE